MIDPDLTCQEEIRREDVRSKSLYGLDYVEVSDDQITITVVFLGKAPPNIEKENIRISGGRRIRNIQVTGLRVNRETDPALDDSMAVTVDKPGDFSSYTLKVVVVKPDKHGRPTEQPMDGFDPRYDEVSFTFKAGCQSDLDCKAVLVCPPPQRTQPEINYLAKDYHSFRQVILDRLALTMPNWQETHAPDLGIALVELLAYAGDYLSYYQDAVATEAYLGTARQRISVRRHARLVDYAMHEGCNSRAWVTIETDQDDSLLGVAQHFYFITSFLGAPDSHVLKADDHGLVNAADGRYEVFEPLVEDSAREIHIYKAHNEIHFYSWGDCQCCLAQGATAATLKDHWVSGSGPALHPRAPKAAAPRPEPPGTVRALNLSVGEVLIFEEVIGPKTGNRADADPKHRQAVRLIKVTPACDPLYHQEGYPDFGQPIVEIEWCSEDALTFPLCISAQVPPPDCTCMENVSVARGNVVLVDNGRTVTGEPLGTVPTKSTIERCTECGPADTVTVPGLFRPTPLKGAPLTFSEPLPPCGCASALITQDPREALPFISLTGTVTTAHGETISTWNPKPDLLESGPDDAEFVVEIDNDSNANLRFGDGNLGRMPEAGTAFHANYRVGNGPAGNVGAETITYLVFRQPTDAGNLRPRNPLPATGGTASETIAEAKLLAPYAFRRVLKRAITADDYATLARDNARRLLERPTLLAVAQANADAELAPSATADDPRAAVEEEPDHPSLLGPNVCLVPFRRLQGAKGTLRWTGSWYEALVAVDPLGTEAADPKLLAEIGAYLEPYRRMGHDLEVKRAQYVPLDLVLTVCVLAQYLRGHVEAALADVFSNRVLPDGRLGFFHPDNLTFGEGIYVSRIVAAAQAVAGVQNVQVTRLERFEISEPLPGVEAAKEELPPQVLSFGPFEIAQLDNDPSFPENGRLTLNMRGGR
jgi:hypothetical protein